MCAEMNVFDFSAHALGALVRLVRVEDSVNESLIC